MELYRMFRFIKQIIIAALMHFGNLSNVNSLECVSMKNQKFKGRPEIVDINNNPNNRLPTITLVIGLLLTVITLYFTLLVLR